MDEIIRILERTEQSDIIVFPKLALCGASCGSLFENPLLTDACGEALQRLCEYTRGRAGYVIAGLAFDELGRTASAIAVIHNGEQVALIPAPEADAPFLNYGFSGLYQPESTVFQCGKLRFCVLGADLPALVAHGSMALTAGCDLIIVPAYAHMRAGLLDEIAESARVLSVSGGCAVAIVNGGAGDTSSPWLYEGFVMVYECGELLTMGRAGLSGIVRSVDLDADIIAACKKLPKFSARGAPLHKIEAEAACLPLMRPIRRNPFLPAHNSEKYLSELFDMQARSLAARMTNIGALKLIIGVSGGIDSVAALLASTAAVDMLDIPRGNIIAVSMPGPGTGSRTHENASRLNKALGVSTREISITRAVQAHLTDIGHGGAHDTAFENAQARERTQILMDIANMENGFVVGTGDLSEEALGFSTFGGDHLANYNVNVCITKTVLRELLAFLRGKYPQVSDTLADVLNTPVSPELLPPDEQGIPTQKTEDILGPYELHDFFLYYFVKYNMRPSKICMYAEMAFEESYAPDFIREKLKLFLRRFCAAQFKRSCAPDSASITEVNLSGVNYYIPSDLNPEMFLRELNENT